MIYFTLSQTGTCSFRVSLPIRGSISEFREIKLIQILDLNSILFINRQICVHLDTLKLRELLVISGLWSYLVCTRLFDAMPQFLIFLPTFLTTNPSVNNFSDNDEFVLVRRKMNTSFFRNESLNTSFFRNKVILLVVFVAG